MKLSQLLPSGHKIISGSTDVKIEKLVIDSRETSQGSLFCALKGSSSDGHSYISAAIQAGAVAIICEDTPEEIRENICYVQVADTRMAIADIARKFFDNPTEKLQLVGVTGTNGKTTTATLLYHLFQKLGYKSGLISTVVTYIDRQEISSKLTTPDIISVNRLLDQMKKAGCDFVFMEVSSHSLDQRRVEGLNFQGAVFTNLTHDHLDYHGSFDNYLKVKKSFFDRLKKNAFALINIDDKHGRVMVQNCPARISTYSQWKSADFKVKVKSNDLIGLELVINGVEIHARLIGEFNAYNLCAAFGVAVLLGQEQMEILKALSDVQPIRGRIEYVASRLRKITGIVDYAHTPDALQQVLETIQGFRYRPARIITVIGCGGDRDRSKRPMMGRIAVVESDLVIFTSDNPRNEDPEAILDDIIAGVPGEFEDSYLRVSSREEAIKTACKLAVEGDIILVAGKGHEDYQEIKGKRFPFDDKKILERLLM